MANISLEKTEISVNFCYILTKKKWYPRNIMLPSWSPHSGIISQKLPVHLGVKCSSRVYLIGLFSATQIWDGLLISISGAWGFGRGAYTCTNLPPRGPGLLHGWQAFSVLIGIKTSHIPNPMSSCQLQPVCSWLKRSNLPRKEASKQPSS